MSAALLGMILLLAQADDPEPVCPGMTTYDMDMCAGEDVVQADRRMDNYLKAARLRAQSEEGKDIAPLIDASQASWEAYLTNECAAVFEQWKSGTIRTLMAAQCQRQLIDRRTHDIWRNWLQYMDSTPPILPEPLPTPDSNAEALDQ